MAIHGSGSPIDMGEIVAEFGGSAPHSLSEYYRGGNYVTTNNTSVPTSGSISFDDFYGAESAGDQVFTSTTTWTAPAGVTSIHVVCVGSGEAANSHSYFHSTATVAGYGCSGKTGGGYVGTGGGNGGSGGMTINCSSWSYGDCGGAGGYSGNGGTAYNAVCSGSYFRSGSGGGGASGLSDYGAYRSRGGGGVGLYGQGASGTSGGAGGSGGGNGSSCYSTGCPGSGYGGNYGGGGRIAGAGTSQYGYGGGGLGWKNNITVTPGNTYTVAVGAGNGAVRIMWGGGRSFPSNAAAL